MRWRWIAAMALVGGACSSSSPARPNAALPDACAVVSAEDIATATGHSVTHMPGAVAEPPGTCVWVPAGAEVLSNGVAVRIALSQGAKGDALYRGMRDGPMLPPVNAPGTAPTRRIERLAGVDGDVVVVDNLVLFRADGVTVALTTQQADAPDPEVGLKLAPIAAANLRRLRSND